MPLNINFQQIALHALNFVLLFGALYFLLYKPVKDFMDARRADYEKMDAEAKANLAAAEQTRAEYEAQLKTVDESIAARRREADAALQRATDEQLARAQAQAADILKKAQQSADAEYEKTMARAQEEISGLVTEATEKLVLRSSTNEAYDQFLGAVERGGENE